MEQEQIDSAVSEIASDLGLGAGEDEHDEPAATGDDDLAAGGDAGLDDAGTAEVTADPTKKPSPDAAGAVAAPTVRAAPKAWAKETHELWGKLSPEAQAQIEHREKQMLDGLTQYGEHAKYGQSIQKALQPYEPMMRAHGLDAPATVTKLFDAHLQLSTGTPEQRTAYLVKVAKNYGLDLSKAAAHATGNTDEPAAVRELRERTDRLEQERNTELTQRQQEQRSRVANEVTTFAEAKDDKGNLKHPHFDECHAEIVALINAGHPLDKAYEKAVFANPVTRAKEMARLQTESEAALRAKAKQEAERARNTTRSNVTSRDTRRAPTASKAGNWEDGMEATLKEIKSRNTTH